MALTADDIAEVKKQLLMTRKKPMNFGLSVTTDPKNMVLKLHLIKDPGVLRRLAKKESGVPKGTEGVATSEGKLLILDCVERPPSGTAKNLRKFIKKVIGLSLKIQLRDPSGVIEEDVEEDAEDLTAAALDETSAEEETLEAEGAEDAAADQDPNEGTAAPDLSATAQALLKKLMPQIKAALEANPRAKAPVESLMAALIAAAKAGDAAALKTRAGQLTQVLAKLAQDGSGGGATTAPQETADAPGLSLVRLGRARIEWPKVRDQAFRDLDRLKQSIIADYADMPDAAAKVQTALKRLDQSLADFHENLHDRLDAVLNADTGARAAPIAAAREMIRGFDQLLASDPVLAELDGNEFLPDIRIQAPLRAQLTEISKALG